MHASVGAVMRQINNYFETGYRATSYRVECGKLRPSECFAPGMYVAITGSIYYSGVWQLGNGLALIGAEDGLPDETFYGRVWFLRPPVDFLKLCDEIDVFTQKTPVGGLQSESFGEYSMTRASGQNGGILTWAEAFRDRLSPYRRMFTEVEF